MSLLGSLTSEGYGAWVLVAGILFGLLGGWVADHRQRPYWQGFLLGFFLGGFGVIAALFVLRRPGSGPRGDERREQDRERERELERHEREVHPLSGRCPSCGATLSVEDRFCPSCGTPTSN